MAVISIAQLAAILERPATQIRASCNLAGLAIAADGTVDFPAEHSGAYRLFFARLAGMPKTPAMQIYHDIRQSRARSR